MLAIEYAHLIIENEIPMIKGTRYKVIDIAQCYLAYGWSPDETHHQHPSLTKSQICSAMAYYYDNQNEIDQQLLLEQEELQQYRASSKQMTRQELLARLKRR